MTPRLRDILARRATATAGDAVKQQEQSTQGYRTGYIRGETFKDREVRYRLRGSLAIFDGDIVLGTEGEMEASRRRVTSDPDVVVFGNVVTETSLRWPGGIVPFRVSAALPHQSRVREAIEHVEKRTPLRFTKWKGEVDFVTFRPGSAMQSVVGRRGGDQSISITPKGTAGHVIHEICHAIGMFHEHGRDDRDDFITIIRANIRPGFEEEFQMVTDDDAVGTYDYDSIMHYGPLDFAVGPTRPTIRAPKPVGQRVRLSAGDIAAIESMYAG